MDTTKEKDLRLQIQDFQMKLNREPDKAELDKTPDGKAVTLPISFVEMTLDEIYLGQWSTRNYSTKQVLNEVVGELELMVVHPITGREIVRVGAASIIIQVDKAPENLQGKERNGWALDPMNKKSNALDLGYPKLKAECTKNAAQTLGKIFGRDLNRKKADKYVPAYKTLGQEGFNALVARVEKGDFNALSLAKSNFVLDEFQLEFLNGINAVKQIKQ